MPERKARVVIIFSLALLILQTKEPLAAADQVLKVPFECASNRNSILLKVRINDKPALLILDTGSAHTVLQPALLGISPSELEPTHLSGSGGGFVGDALGQEVSFQLGSWKWQKRKVAVMDLSEVLSSYKERIDGVLGLDFFKEFRSMAINFKEKTITFVR